jgi:DNA-binding MarR family transcriptional regulator
MSKNLMPDEGIEEIEQIAQLLAETRRALMRSKPRPPSKAMADFTFAQGRSLWIITRHEPCTLSELSERMNVRPSTASELVERLVVAGFVTRTADPQDRRTIRLKLTRKGHALHQKYQAREREQTRELIEKLTPQQRKAMNSALKTLTGILRQIEGESLP